MHEDLWVRSQVAATLGQEGYTVLAASNGASGMRLAEQHQPAVIVLGMALPELSGAVVLEHLHGCATTRDIPVLVVSDRVADPGVSSSPGADGSPRPVTLDDLLPEVERALQPPRASALVREHGHLPQRLRSAARA
jgi:DNA-binding response OmpR family regulator